MKTVLTCEFPLRVVRDTGVPHVNESLMIGAYTRG